MSINIKPGNNIPDDINVIIEITTQNQNIKYEFDKNQNMLYVDRFIPISLNYPCNYGFIPNTLSEDQDPLDVLVLSPYKLNNNIMINCRPIGLLNMEDESGIDKKILAVPSKKITNLYDNINNINDVSEYLLKKIEYFFKHYKDLDKHKWTKVHKWGDKNDAKEEIKKCIINK